ncbi:MAG: carboxymuconolactone decarboxylase family protein [Chitinophagaceae bacterium]|nr:MAG: carboxymuconolactone decarboxylase family protein [Chitinophagaceae bacterium]
MENRFNLAETEPQGMKAMVGLETYIRSSGIDKKQLHLIKYRASQINGCAYCLDMHSKEALKDGESVQRLMTVGAWRETSLFTPEEQAILMMTEEITNISHSGLSDATYKLAEKYFDKSYIAKILMVVVTINAWNRIAISTHLQIGD